MKWSEVIPVVVSVVVIIVVAVVEKESKLVAAITATMPLTAPLALWIVYSANQGEQAAVVQFAQSMLIGIVPTVAFILAVWLAARLGLKLVPMIVMGYATWATVLVLIIGLRRVLSSF